jgi:drug/metabolite transporter (DMT)-like permease
VLGNETGTGLAPERVMIKKAFLQLHAAVFLAGFTAIFGKLIGLNEGLLVWYRMLLTAGVLAWLIARAGKFPRLAASETMRLFGVGGIIAFHWMTFYGSVKYGNVSVAVVCLSASGFFSALLEPLIVGRKLALVELLLGLISMAGVAIIFDFHPHLQTGVVLGILSALGSALFPIYNKQLIDRHDPETLTFYEMTGGFLCLSALMPFYLHWNRDYYFWPTGADWLYLLVLVLACTVLCFHLQLRALRHISAFTVNLSYNLEPVYSIILAFLFFRENENLHPYFYLGVSLILLSVVLQMWRVWKKRNKNTFN